MKMMNLWEWLFGIDSDYGDNSDDYLHSLTKWCRILFGNRRQMNIFMAAFYLISINQIAFIIYVIFWKPELHDVVAMLPSESLISLAQSYMLFISKAKSLYPEWLEHINIDLEYLKLCSKELKSRLEYESGIRKYLTHISIIVAIFNFILYTWKDGDSKHFFALFVMGKFGEELLILDENLGKLNCKYTENENYQLHNNQYQKMIEKKLMSCWKHYLNIRRLNSIVNEISYWPIYSGIMHCVLLLGTIFIYFLLGGLPTENPGMVFTIFIVLTVMLVISEQGQFIKNEAQNVHNTLSRTQWYQWNRENRKFLLIFLIATQEPLQISSFGIEQCRDMYVKVLKGLYSLITCISSTRN